MDLRTFSEEKFSGAGRWRRSATGPDYGPLARTFRWQALIDSGTYRNTVELAVAIGKDPAFVARMIRLTLLAPEIVHAILAGTLQKSFPINKLSSTMPERWADQKKLFGLD